jgi:outer membrane autotransporter protein
LAKTNDPRLAPYARADVIRTIGGRAQITTSSDAWNISNTFAGGRVGTSYRLGAGVTSQLTAHIALYGEADYLHDTGGHGLSGWSADAGLRINF